MAKPKIFIDGREGTTGLQIYDKLISRDNIELLLIDEDKRKDISERKKLLNEADLVFLCLPDEAAKESVSLIDKNSKTRVIDASTAHRTDENWVYGLPELSKTQLDKIKHSRFVANPGCHATGIIASVYPLITLGIMPKDYPLSIFSLTGYSGGGKAMIHAYTEEKLPEMYAPRIYGLNLEHKHIPEIMHITDLTNPPIFCPIVDDYYSGMATTAMLHTRLLNMGKGFTSSAVEASLNPAMFIHKILTDYYQERHAERPHKIAVAAELGTGMLSANQVVNSDDMIITVSGNDDLIIITAQFDNLGKGASGAAIQNMEIMLGIEN